MLINLTSLLFSLSTALDYVEKEFVGVSTFHCRRVAAISMQICKHLEMKKSEIIDMGMCSILHDSALTEFNVKTRNVTPTSVKKHCVYGEQNVSKFPFFEGDVKNIVLYHHENYDGSGYFSKTGSQIPKRAAILRLIDNIDLIFNLAHLDDAEYLDLCKHLVENTGKLYDPKIVQAFNECISRDFLNSLCEKNIENTLRELIGYKIQDVQGHELVALGSMFSSIIDAKSHFTLYHSQGISYIAAIMAKHYDFDELHTACLITAASLHDIGKLMVTNDILEKPGALSKEEFTIMKTHAHGTYEILSGIEGMESICDWACQHHERLTGKGYPFGLNREELSFESRLLACIDIYQALTEDRPYRAGMSHEAAMKIIYDLANNGELELEIVMDLDRIMGGHKKFTENDIMLVNNIVNTNEIQRAL